MKCNEIRKLLSPYIDHMLINSQMKKVEAHLSTCDSCKKEYTELMEIVGLLRQVENVPVPDSFDFIFKKTLMEEKKGINIYPNINKITHKKKIKWRVISSIAAIFAVGILSVGMYNDILGIVPDKINGSDQTGTIYKEKDNVLEDSASSEETSNLKLVPNDSQIPDNNLYKLENESIQAPEISTLGLDANEMQDNNLKSEDQEKTDLLDNTTSDMGEDVSISRQLNASDVEVLNKYKIMMPIQGVERNSAAVKYYNNLIEEKLQGFDYQITDYVYSLTGEWTFKVFIFTGKDGNTYNDEVLIIGRNGVIEVLYSNEFMGL